MKTLCKHFRYDFKHNAVSYYISGHPHDGTYGVTEPYSFSLYEKDDEYNKGDAYSKVDLNMCKAVLLAQYLKEMVAFQNELKEIERFLKQMSISDHWQILDPKPVLSTDIFTSIAPKKTS